MSHEVSPHIARFKSSPVWSLVVATARFERGRHAVDAASQLRSADARLIWFLSSEGPRTMKEISELLGLEQSTVNRQVNAALGHGFVERVEQADDEGVRARRVRVTVAGEEAFARDLDAAMGIHRAALEVLPEEERERFMENLLLFADAYRAEAHAAGSRPPA